MYDGYFPLMICNKTDGDVSMFVIVCVVLSCPILDIYRGGGVNTRIV